jgi:hypothetical protein
MHFEPGVENAVKVSIAIAAEFGPLDQIKSDDIQHTPIARMLKLRDLAVRSIQNL